MAVLLIIIIGLTLAVSAVIFIALVKSTVRSHLRRSKRIPVLSNTDPADIGKFNCRCVLLKSEDAEDNEDGETARDGQEVEDTFKLEICGTIHAPEDLHETTARISVSDITDGVYKAMSVHSSVDQWQIKNSRIFCFNADLGRLPKAETVLPDWMAVTEFSCDTLILPRTGTRVLQFRTSIFSHETNEEIAYAAYEIVYENPDQGYLDVEEEIYHANGLGLSLGFSFAASGENKVSQSVANILDKWAKNNLDRKHQPGKTAMKAQRILAGTLGRFRLIEKIRTTEICCHINDIAPLAVKCNILLLCLRIISTCHEINARQIVMLKNTAKLLGIRTDRLRSMIEDMRPFAMHQVKDMEISLGITADMDDEQVRRQLSTEYRKWNSRVINTSADIRNEAENMLELIGETKEELSI